MRERIENCRGQIEDLIDNKDAGLSALERTVLKNCSYQLQCMHHYCGENENSYQFAVDNIRNMINSTAGINHKKARDLVKLIATLLPTVKSEADHSNKAQRHHHSLPEARPKPKPQVKRSNSFRAPNLFRSTEPKSEDIKTPVKLGRHRKK